MSELRLLIVAPDPLARAGLATLLADLAELQIVGQVGLTSSLPNEIDVYQPEVILWDLGWDPEDSLAMLADLSLSEAEDPLSIVALLADDEPAMAAWASGVRGLLYRESSPERILAAVICAGQALAVVEPALLDILRPSSTLAEPPLAEPLTDRELEVLQLLAEGLANKAIAQRLAISEHTVKFHVNALMSKLGVQSRTAAVVRANRLGLIVL